jgi:hypothetical protein
MGTGKSMKTWFRAWTLLVVVSTFGLSACGNGEEQAIQSLGAEEVVAYWSVWGKKGDNYHIHPIVRFQIRNNGESDVDYIQTMAVFRLEGSPEEPWGNAYEYSIAGDPIPPGGLSRVVTLRCDSTFFSKDQPRTMLENEQWEQVYVEIFLRVGSSKWQSVTKQEVPRRLGAPGVEKFLEPPEEPQPEKKQ